MDYEVPVRFICTDQGTTQEEKVRGQSLGTSSIDRVVVDLKSPGISLECLLNYE